MRVATFVARHRVMLFGLGLTCAVTFAGAARHVHSSQGNEYPAFTVEYSEGTSSPSSTARMQREMYWAFRSDGATSNGFRDKPILNRTVLDPTAMIQADVSDRLALTTNYDRTNVLEGRRPRPRQSPTCAPPAGRPGYRFLGEETILGFNTYIYEHHQDLESGAKTMETRYWLAPDLRCFEMKTVSDMRNARGEVTSHFEKLVANVRMGEPDPDLFSVPASYREVPPSEFATSIQYDDIAQREGPERAALVVSRAPASWKATLVQKDARYLASKRPR